MITSPKSTIVDYIVPGRGSSRAVALLRDGLLILGVSILMALSVRARIYLPFTPVPLTLQTFLVLLAGAALGSKRGALAMLLYLAEGAAGLPVFTTGGGLASLVGLTAGYLWSYPVAAFVVGWLCERGMDRSYLTSIFAMLPGAILNLAVGTLWLAILGLPAAHGIDHGFVTAMLAGFVPFIPGEAIKMVIAAALLPTAWMVVRRTNKVS
ncbi:biotin transporter BioY [Ktedonospora formicarum]|uniref:Biotin transporter n=1 Tax=Ktedonospora formicarum TaxID=2778364 RepID=A0A8J3I0M3_9CHLR|nr:biotin transporter BioY [Ktedonospora formicarum]GHO42714.1 biotin biosynthesis protein BioY [Ktedonospora formicarum]